MNKPQLLKWKIATGLACLALLIFVGSASATLTVTTANQKGSAPFTPTWAPASDSLINGVVPTLGTGNYTEEVAGRNPNWLTLATTANSLKIFSYSGTTSTNYVTCGGAGGTALFYTLPANVNGYNLTNITVFGGWLDNGRDAQGYNVWYSTVSDPTNWIYLTSVNYQPGGASQPTSTKAVINDTAGAVIAANVARVWFDFSGGPSEPNGYQGYAAITVEGSAAPTPPTFTISTQTQQGGAAITGVGVNPFTPTYTLETPSLIAGLAPSTATGNFGYENTNCSVNTLTANGNLTINAVYGNAGDSPYPNTTTSTNYITCGAKNGTGSTIIYSLPSAGYGIDVTNIVVYNGWKDTGRMGQYYILSYSTVAAPSTFIPLTTINYLPAVTSGLPTANRVACTAWSNNVPIAGAVAAVKLDFASPYNAVNFNNGFQGYAQIIVQGNNTASPPPPPSPILVQDTLPAYAATVIGDSITFTAAYSNSPPVTTEWLQIVGAVTNVLTGMVNVTNNGVVTSTVTVNNLQLSNSGYYTLAGFNATNNAAAPSYSSAVQLVVNSPPAATGNIIMDSAEQLGLGAISPVNGSTNFYPSWTVNTANDLILGAISGSGPGTFVQGSGNFDMNIPVYGGGAGPLDPDPTILSDGLDGYLTYWPAVGGNFTQCSCGAGGSGAGDTMTYTLNTSVATYGFDLTNITVYGGWGDAGRNEQKYEVLYSTVSNPTVFTSLGVFDYNPTDPSGLPTATRTMLIPVSGALAQNVAQVEINWNVTSAPKNNWEGYSEVVVQGIASLNNPILVQDTLPATAFTTAGDQITFSATFSNAPAANLQWQFISNSIVTDLPGMTTSNLTLANLQTNNSGSYRLKAVSIANSSAITYSTAAQLTVSAVPAAVGNIITTTANQTFLGAISSVNLSTNYTPTWTENTNNDLILGSMDGSVGTPGTVSGNPGTAGFAPLNSNCNSDPAILSDGSPGYLNYYPGIGGNSTLVGCGNNAGYSVTYTLPASSATGWSLTNITVYGGWGSNGRDELKYEVLYSTVSAPTTFNHLISVDYNPAGGSPNLPSASRTMLLPAAGAMAQNVAAVEINFFNAASISENGWSGYSEIVVAGQPSPPVPVLTTNVTPTTAEDVVGSSLILMANFSGATSYQWLKNGTNLPGATSPTLLLNNLQLSDMATNSGYSLVASNSSGTNMTSFCKVYVDPAPTAVSNIVTAIAYQTSTTAGFTPTWDTSMLGLSLIAGQNPPIIGYDPIGNFNDPDNGIQAHNLAGGLTVLTDGGYGAFDNTGAHPAFATGGPGGPSPGAGQYVIYQLGNYSPNANGYDITNIQIAGGWNDNGRNSQYYTVSYSTVANPTMFFPMVVEANNLSSGNALGGGTGEAVPAGAGIPTIVRTTFTPASGLLASNVYAIFVDFTIPNSVPNAYSGYSEISVFGSPSAAAPVAGPVIIAQHEEYADSFTLETDSLIANQLPSSHGPGVFTNEGCSEAGLTDGLLSFGGNTNSASCGDDGTAVPWIVFTPTNGTWNITNIVVYTLWHDYGRDGQFYNVSYSTLSNPTTFLPLASVAYNPFVVHDGRASGNRVAIAPPVGQTLLASNVAAVKFDFTPQGIQDFGWSGYTEIVLEGTNVPSTVVTPPILGAPRVSGGNLILTGTGGTAGAGYTWLTTTNLSPPIVWMTNSTGTLDGSGAFSNSIPIGTNPASFFWLRLP